jgi:prevent-host-death family protein
MRKVTATTFQNEIGRFLDAAQAEPVMVTSHGRDKAVLLSARDYQRLSEAAERQGSGAPPRQHERPRVSGPGAAGDRVNDPVSMALSIVNTSTPAVIDEADLRDAVSNPNTRYRAQARLLLNDVSENVLAGLVIRKFVTWRELAELAKRVGVDSHEKAAFIRDMAGLALG